MPPVIAAIGAVAAAIGLSTFQLIMLAVAVIAKFALPLLMKNKADSFRPRPSTVSREVQHNIRQSAYPRYKVMGIARVGGLLWFFAASKKKMYVATILSQGAIHSIISYYVRDIECLIDASNYVTTPPFRAKSGRRYVKFQRRMGRKGQTASSLLMEAFPDTVTEDHILKGISYLVAVFTQPPEKNFQRVFRSQIPEVAAVVRGCFVYDPRVSTAVFQDSGTWVWTTNPVLLVLDYLINSDGMKLGLQAINLPSFAALANWCDEKIQTRDQGRRPRYELGGIYSFDEDPADVLNAMLDSFSGELYTDMDGSIAITADGFETATVVITEDMVIELDAKRLSGALFEYSVVKCRYTSEKHGYFENGEEAEPWIDEDIRARIGRDIPFQFDLPMVFRHDQARRLMKMKFHDLNPEWSIEAVLDYNGLALFGERLARMVYAPLGIDQVFRVGMVAPDEGEDGFARISVKLASVNMEAFRWDAAREEGTAPVVPPVTDDDEAPVAPTGLAAVVGQDGSNIQALITWTAKTSGKTQETQWKLASDPNWTTITTGPDDYDRVLANLTLDAEYIFRVRVVDDEYGVSPWSQIYFTATPIAGTTGALQDFTAEGGIMRIDAEVKQSSAVTAAWADITYVDEGAAISWANAKTAELGAGKRWEAEFKIDEPGKYDVYARSYGLNGDIGPAAGPINVRVRDKPDPEPPPPPPPGGGGGDDTPPDPQDDDGGGLY